MSGSRGDIAAEKTAMPDDQLEVWLHTKVNRRPLVRSLSALEGFVCALVAGPVLPNPVTPIFSALGLPASAINDGSTPAFAALSAAVVHFNRVSGILSETPELFQPWFARTNADPRPWCQGFHDAVELNRKHWKPILTIDNPLHGLLLPILIYCKDKRDKPVLGPPRPGPQTEAFLEHEAHRDIPTVVAALRQHHRVSYTAD
jgi:yecA family protein